MHLKPLFFKKKLFFILSFITLSFLSVQKITAKESTQPCQFSYKYQNNEIVINDKPGFELSPSIEKFAKHLNKNLNKSLFFQTDFIGDNKKVRSHHLKKKHDPREVGQLFDITTHDGIVISCTFFDRGSDTLLIAGGGFTNSREKMTPFVDMFDCDIVLFDFRGHGYKEFSITDPSTWSLSFAKYAFEIDADIVSLGLHEDKDVFAVVDFFKKRKKYRMVNGLGVCYGAFIFLKAAAIRADLFNKIILDGCWLSLPLFVDKIKKDPKLMLSPQTGGWSKQWPFSNSKFIQILELFCHDLIGLKFQKNISLLDYLPALDKNIPLLFFYGKDDLVIFRNEFEILWNAAQTNEKIAIITSNPHVRNHLKQKELYKLLCDLFLELDQKTFVSYLKDSKLLANHYADKVLSFTDDTQDDTNNIHYD